MEKTVRILESNYREGMYTITLEDGMYVYDESSEFTIEQMIKIKEEIAALLSNLKEKKEKKETFKISLGFALEKTTLGLIEFFDDIGFNSWCLNEGFCSRDDIIEVDVDILKKHGIL